MWRKDTGVKKGNLHCEGVVEPPERQTAPTDYIYDAIVIGAGYSGLMAARDMTDCGKSIFCSLQKFRLMCYRPLGLDA